MLLNTMAKRKQFDLETRARIVALHDMKVSNRAIALELQTTEYCVRQTIEKKEETGHLQDRRRSRRPRIRTKGEDQYIKVLSLRNRPLTAPEVEAEFSPQHQSTFSVSTVKRRLAEAELHGRIAAKNLV